jgi:hypothetical protein
MSKLQAPFQGALPGWAIPRVETISANRTRGPWVGEWLLSRRDRLIVARHEVPGKRCRELRPGGTVEVIVSPRGICPRNRVHAALETPGTLSKGMLASNLSRDPFNRPAGTRLFPYDSRHFVPGNGVRSRLYNGRCGFRSASPCRGGNCQGCGGRVATGQSIHGV